MSGDDFADEKTVIGDRVVLALEGMDDRPEQAYLRVLTGPMPGQLFRVGDGGDLGRGTNVSFHIPDSQISRRHARLRAIGGEVVLQDLDSTNGTFVNGERVTTRRLRDGDTIRLGHTTALRFTWLSEIDGEIQEQMFESALRDGLTKAYNKRFFETRLEEEVAYAIRQDSRLALLYFDLDHFKPINDEHGHLAGDYVLAELSALVTETSRREDVFARIGGEEFAILSRGLTRQQAMDFGERIRRAIHEHAFEYEGVHIPVTSSVGVACIPDAGADSATTLVAAADAALYRAKTSGRNRVESA
jgi:two-component system, cell cycle response regulator